LACQAYSNQGGLLLATQSREQIGSNQALWPSVTGKGEDPAQWPADLRVAPAGAATGWSS
jgi:hypothetical protein